MVLKVPLNPNQPTVTYDDIVSMLLCD